MTEMGYIGNAILILFLLGLTSAGWYYLFKRFERRMNARFDDLVERNEETMKSFSDAFEILWTVIQKIETVHVQAASITEEQYRAEAKLDIIQGLALSIKQDSFLNYARAVADVYREDGGIDEEALARLKALIEEMKLENYARY
jgi:hypothetical protein